MSRKSALIVLVSVLALLSEGAAAQRQTATPPPAIKGERAIARHHRPANVLVRLLLLSGSETPAGAQLMDDLLEAHKQARLDLARSLRLDAWEGLRVDVETRHVSWLENGHQEEVRDAPKDPDSFDFLVTWVWDLAESTFYFRAEGIAGFQSKQIRGIETWTIERVSDPSIFQTWEASYEVESYQMGPYMSGKAVRKLAQEATERVIAPKRTPILAGVVDFIQRNRELEPGGSRPSARTAPRQARVLVRALVTGAGGSHWFGLAISALASDLGLVSGPTLRVREERTVRHEGAKYQKRPGEEWAVDPGKLDFLVNWNLEFLEHPKDPSGRYRFTVTDSWRAQKTSDPSVNKTWTVSYDLAYESSIWYDSPKRAQLSQEQAERVIAPLRGPIVREVVAFIESNSSNAPAQTQK